MTASAHLRQQSLIKALFMDLDGTLLNSRSEISPRNHAVLRECQDAGIRLFVATGRSPRVRRQLGLTSREAQTLLSEGGIFHNGACICHAGARHYTTMPRQTAQQAVEIVAAHPGVNLALQMPGDRHSFRYELDSEEQGLWGIEPRDLVPWGELAGAEGEAFEVVKIVVFGGPSTPQAVIVDLHAQLCRALDVGANLYLSGGEFRTVDVTAKGASKRRAVERLAGWWGLCSEQVAVIGDDRNDVEMLAAFEHSVAMGNACPEAKAAATHTAPSNDDDGVYHAVTSILKLV